MEVAITETFNITPEQAAAYQELFVPALFAQWAPMMADLAESARVSESSTSPAAPASRPGLLPTGVGGSGSVVGLERQPGDARTRARGSTEIEWCEGDRRSCPSRTESFDAVLCQSAVFFFPDVDRAFTEMARVVRRGGLVAIQTYAALADQSAYQEFDAVVRRIAPGEALDLLDTYWSMGDLAALGAALKRAGLEIVGTRTTLGTVRYGTVENLVAAEIRGTPLADRLSQSQIDQILAECATILSPFVSAERGLEMPITAHLVAARQRDLGLRLYSAAVWSWLQPQWRARTSPGPASRSRESLMRDASSTTGNSRSAGPSPLRLRVGVLLVLLWIVPFWLLAPGIAHALSGGSNPPSVAAVTTTILVVQTIIGLVGLWVAGTQVKSIIKGSTKRHAIAEIWSILLHGDIQAKGDGGNNPKEGRPAREDA